MVSDEHISGLALLRGFMSILLCKAVDFKINYPMMEIWVH